MSDKLKYRLNAIDTLGLIFGWYKDKHGHYRVPDGFQVHHIDGDCTNNSLDNLTILTIEEHRTIHMLESQKRVMCVETGIVYESASEASRQTGVQRTHIGKVCNGKPRYKTAGGYHWRYVDE